MRRVLGLAAVAAGTLALAACAGASGTPAAAPSAAAGSVDLSGVCPKTVSVQTDWYPEAEHGHLYQLLGEGYTIDAKTKSVTGPLVTTGGKPTGINIQIRAGGPAIGFQLVSTQLYQHKDITFGYVGTDDAIAQSKTFPTTAVFGELNTSPFMVMWDPATYPGVSTLPQLGQALKKNGAVVRYFNGSAYMQYLISSGVFPKDTTDGSYDGTPAKFVAGRGKDAQQGFASAEPYIYQHQVPAWNKPVKYALLSTAGWTSYASAMSVRTGELAGLKPCLEKLVPVMQHGLVDFMANPKATNETILKLDKAYSRSWPYTIEVAGYAVQAMKDNKIVSDGGAAYVGSFDPARVEKMLTVAKPIFEKSRNMDPGVKAEDLYTNEFLDKTVKLGY